MGLEVYRDGGSEYKQPSQPNVVNPGTLWFNSDGGNNAMADGTNYGAYPLRIGIAGYAAGGFNGANSNSINKIVFFNETTSSISATLFSARTSPAGVRSKSSGYTYKGDPAITQIDKLLFETEATSTLTSTTYNGILSHGGGFSSELGGYALAQNGLYSTAIDRIYFSNDNASLIGATLSIGRDSAGCESQSYGYAMNGATSASTASNKIDKLRFSDDTISAITSSPTPTLMASGACNSDIKGFMLGGKLSGVVHTEIRNVVFSNDSVNNVTSSLTTALNSISCNNSYEAGYIMGGNTSATVFSGTNVVTKFQFSDNSISNITSTLTVSADRQAGYENLNNPQT